MTGVQTCALPISNVDFTNAQSLAEAARQATAAGRPDLAQQLAQQAVMETNAQLAAIKENNVIC